MKPLSVIGTLAMFLVGGGILVHGFQYVSSQAHLVEHWVGTFPSPGESLKAVTHVVFNGTLGLMAGGVVVGLAGVYSRLRSRSEH